MPPSLTYVASGVWVCVCVATKVFDPGFPVNEPSRIYGLEHKQSRHEIEFTWRRSLCTGLWQMVNSPLSDDFSRNLFLYDYRSKVYSY